MPSNPATDVLEKARAARANGKYGKALRMLRRAIKPLREMGDVEGLHAIVEEASAIEPFLESWEGYDARVMRDAEEGIRAIGHRKAAARAGFVPSFHGDFTPIVQGEEWTLARLGYDYMVTAIQSPDEPRGDHFMNIEEARRNFEDREQTLLDCTVLGRYGLDVAPQDNVNLAFTDAVKVHRGDKTLSTSWDEMERIEVGGPGAVTRGGGFIGGGIGSATSMIEGVGIAAILNSLTTRTSIHSIIRVQAANAELIVHYGYRTPEDLEAWLSTARGRTRAAIKDREGAQTTDPVDRLEKLAAMVREGTITDEEFAEAKRKILNNL